jgi:hypothetical protein
VDRQQPIQPGDMLRIGPLTFKVQYTATPPPPEPEPAFEPLEDDAAQESGPFIEPVPLEPVADDTPIPLLPEPESEGGIEVVFDDADTMKLPEGEDFRDFLRKMDK